MKIGLISKALIGSMALSSCQKPVQNVLYPHITSITRNVDTFTSSNINPEKTFDLIKNIAGFFTDGMGSFSFKTAVKNKKPKISARPKIAKKVKKKNITPSIKNKKTVSKSRVSTPITPASRKISSTTDGGNYWIKGGNISFGHPTEYTVPNGEAQKGVKIAGAHGVSLYRLKIANPEINFEKPVSSGTIVKIPGRYIVQKGSVKSFDDVVKTTKINKHYIKDILIGIEGRKQKPDLVCKSDRVRSKEYPNGCPTIGFGHTGRIDGKEIVNGKTRISNEQAYEILAQDILDAKVDAIVYMGKPLFDSAPESVQTGIIDIVFNKGVEPFTRAGSPTMLIKGDLERKDYAAAAAHTVLKTGNRGLKKRNVYRMIISTESLNHAERNRALTMARPHLIDALSRFPGAKKYKDRALMQKSWDNAKKGITHGFFSK